MLAKLTGRPATMHHRFRKFLAMHAPSTLPTLALSIGLLLSGPAAADASPAPAPPLSDQVAPPAPSASPLPAMTGTTPAVPPVEQPPSEPAIPPSDPPADTTPPVEEVIGTAVPGPATGIPTTSPAPAPDVTPAPPASDAPAPPSSPVDDATPAETDPTVEADNAPDLPGGQQPGVGEAVVVERSVPRAPQPVPSENSMAPSLVPTPVEEVRIDKVEQVQQVEQVEQAEGFQTPVEGTSIRYTIAGILSIVALLLTLAIAFVAQPRRPRGTH